MTQYAPLISALVTMMLTFILISSKTGKIVTDVPNESSLHDSPIPRIGGVALMAGILTGWAMMLTSLVWWIVLPLIGLFVASLLDDIQSLSVKKRLWAHLAAAAVLVIGSGLFTQHGFLIALAVLLFTVWMTNLYDFMDGCDGLAGGMALFGFSFYGLAALIANDHTMAMFNFTIGAATLGFLYYNFHPAKVLLGDAGSIPLGFLAAGMGLWGWQLGYWAAWFPVIVFSPFIVDASMTLAKRTLRGVRITEAHREHYYQRAIQMGSRQHHVALVEYGLMLGAGGSALWSLQQVFPWRTFVILSVFYMLLMSFLDVLWKRFMMATK